MSLLNLLTHYVRTNGPIETARVSSAQCGSSCPWAYWGAVRYEIRLGRDGSPTNVARERAGRDRRSVAGAERDCDAMCEREGRLPLQRIGRLTEYDAQIVLRWIAEGVPAIAAAIERHDARQVEPSRKMTLQQRVIVRHLLRENRPGYGRSPRAVRQAVAAGKFVRVGRWIRGEWNRPEAYVPYRDERDAVEFAREPNQEARRKILAACGDRVLPPAELVQMDDYGRLYRAWDGRQSVHVICPSTGSQYVLPVSSWCKTAKQAVAETFGLNEVEYSPTAEA